MRCPVCNTNKEGRCFLVPIDGTTEGRICEAAPTHVDCVSSNDDYRMNMEVGVIYLRIHPEWKYPGGKSSGTRRSS